MRYCCFELSFVSGGLMVCVLVWIVWLFIVWWFCSMGISSVYGVSGRFCLVGCWLWVWIVLVLRLAGVWCLYSGLVIDWLFLSCGVVIM